MPPVVDAYTASSQGPRPSRAASARPAALSSSATALQRCQSASSRRSRLVGRPCSMALAGSAPRRRASAAFSRAAMLSGVSAYSACATGAGPRTLLSASRSTVRSHGALAQLDAVADLQLARGLGRLAVDADAAAADLVGGQRARLVEARGPQPLVQAHAGVVGHGLVLGVCSGVTPPAAGARWRRGRRRGRPVRGCRARCCRPATARSRGRSPAPGPSRSLSREASVAKGWNRRWRCSAAMPGPLSATVSAACAGVARAAAPPGARRRACA